MTMLKIYNKLERLNAGAVFDEENIIIRLPCYDMTAYVNDDAKPEIDMEYNCRRYKKVFSDFENFYSFLSGVLTGKISFRQIDERNIIADGYSPISADNLKIKRIFRGLFNTIVGLPLAIFGVLLAVVGLILNVDYSSPSLLYDLCPLPFAVSLVIIGVSMIHHGFTKKPAAVRHVLSYGAGVVFVCFALSMLMVTYGDKTEDIAIADVIGLTFMFTLVLAVGIFFVVVGLRGNGRSPEFTPLCTLRRTLLDSAKLKLMADKIKELTATEAIEITTAPFGNMGVTDSKFGGLHYWDMSIPYPENMSFLAQFNLSQLPKTAKLPNEGMLQFFSDCEDKCKVVYHKKIDPDYTADIAASLEITTESENEFMAFEGECGLEFKLTEMYIGLSDVFGSDIVRKAAAELGFEVADDAELYEFPLEDEVTGHHLLGYPCFSQYDPRDPNGKYNTLLFQLDSEMSERFSIMWGDCGVANFFINDKDLENLNFDDVFFTWDCF